MAKPYHLCVKMKGRPWQSLFESDNPEEAREYHARVSRNHNVVERIELRDAQGTQTLETIWDASWFYPTEEAKP